MENTTNNQIDYEQMKIDFLNAVQANLVHFSLYFCKDTSEREYYKFAIHDESVLTEIVAETTCAIADKTFKAYEECNDFSSICVFEKDNPLIDDKFLFFTNFSIHSSDRDLNLTPKNFSYYSIMSSFENNTIQFIRFNSPYKTLKHKWYFFHDSENNAILHNFENYFSIDTSVDVIIWNNYIFMVSKKGETILDLSIKIADKRDELYAELETLDFITNFSLFKQSTTRNSKCVLSYNPNIIEVMKKNPTEFQKHAKAAGLQFSGDKVLISSKESAVTLLHFICNKRIDREWLNQIIECDNPRIS